MPEERQVIQLHTIDQWFQVDKAIRLVIMQHIQLKERLWAFLVNRNRQPQKTEPGWVRCSKCADSPFPGYILFEPRYDGLHPSQIGQPCLLKIYKQMMGEEGTKRPDARLQVIFDIGHAVHHMFQTYGLNGAWGPIYKQEVEVSGKHQPLAADLMIEGHADAENVLVVDNIPHAPIYEVGIVHEYKTINSNNFSKLRAPKPEHKQQAMLYSAALNRPITCFLYLNKDDSSMVDFPVEFDPDIWALLEAKARRLKEHYEEGNAPPADVGFHCRDCEFTYTCTAHRKTQKEAGK